MLIEENKISVMGTYAELIESSPRFISFISDYFQSNEDAEENNAPNQSKSLFLTLSIDFQVTFIKLFSRKSNGKKVKYIFDD